MWTNKENRFLIIKLKKKLKIGSKMSEETEHWEKNPELEKYFANIGSFRCWYGKNIHPLANPTIEEIIKKAKKRFLCGNDRVKFNKRHNIRRDNWWMK